LCWMSRRAFSWRQHSLTRLDGKRLQRTETLPGNCTEITAQRSPRRLSYSPCRPWGPNGGVSSSSSSTDSPAGSAISSLSQRPRSMRRQRSLQKGIARVSCVSKYWRQVGQLRMAIFVPGRYAWHSASRSTSCSSTYRRSRKRRWTWTTRSTARRKHRPRQPSCTNRCDSP
jgi:hypothetical protein